MKKIRINLFIICLLGVLAEVCAQESTWREMPYFLKGYENNIKNLRKKLPCHGLKMPVLDYLYIGGRLLYTDKASG